MFNCIRLQNWNYLEYSTAIKITSVCEPMNLSVTQGLKPETLPCLKNFLTEQ